MPAKLKIEHIEIDAVFPNGFNVNVVSPDNEAKIEASIKRFGFFKPVLCREIERRLEIIGGEHRWAAAKRLGYKDVPVINLGEVDDQKAKELCLVDNSRYGADDALQLAELLNDLGSVDELTSFMPYTEGDLASIFSSVNIELDDLELSEIDETASLPKEKPIQTHQVVRFKIPLDDASWLTQLIERTMKVQKFTESDSLANAGDALVHLLKNISH
jgi:ParB-like chromosome segregation protein Spo0J